MQPMFTNRTVNSFDTIINAMTKQMLQRWEQRSLNETIWLDREMGHVAFQIVSRALFGADIDQYSEHIVEILKVINTNPQTLRAMLTLLPWLPVPSNRHFLRMRSQLDRIVHELIERRRKQGVGDDDMLDRLLATRNTETGKGMSETQLRDEIVTLLLAGHETIYRLQSFVKYRRPYQDLASYPHPQTVTTHLLQPLHRCCVRGRSD